MEVLRQQNSPESRLVLSCQRRSQKEIWEGLAPKFHPYYFSIGLRRKQELYVISQAIRCKSSFLKPDNKVIPKVYL